LVGFGNAVVVAISRIVYVTPLVRGVVPFVDKAVMVPDVLVPIEDPTFKIDQLFPLLVEYHTFV
jgi:hypothetical protein